uniref:Uncharacterized protein n=1 Tax=Leersia perrieri TaxID=77586 RepID=A0A0D9VRC9_9ORYZ
MLFFLSDVTMVTRTVALSRLGGHCDPTTLVAALHLVSSGRWGKPDETFSGHI